MSVLPMDDNWCVVDGSFNVQENLHWESVMALGTGYVTTRSSVDEGFEDDDQSVEYTRIPGNVSLEKLPTRKSRWGTYLPVVQANHPLWRLGIVNLPYYLGFTVAVDGEKLDLEGSQIRTYRRWLDMRTATLYRTLRWETRSGKQVELLFSRYMDPREKFVCVQECELKSISGSASIHVAGFVDNDVRTNGYDVFARRAVAACQDGLVYSDVTTNVGNRVVTASRLLGPVPCTVNAKPDARRVSSECTFTLGEGKTVTVRKVSVTAADVYFNHDNVLSEAGRIVDMNARRDPAESHDSHKQRWAEFWRDADIVIEADDRPPYNSQRAIRQAIYHLNRAKAPDEDRGLICPKGVTTEVYMGSVFWDMEIFIEPFYIYTNPEAARTVHMFRYLNLPAARELTRSAGYRGVRYPWMSAANGTETCPMWEYADHQIHITSDVVAGIWHYYKNSKDEEFLHKYGAEIVIETARYWVDRAEKLPGRSGYHLCGVMGPDEYKPITNNNAYTNFSAKFNLRLACEIARLMQKKVPGEWNALKQKLDFRDEELARFVEVEQGISIPKDDLRSIIWQCDDFETAFVEPDIDEVWKDKSELFGMYYSQEKRYRSKTLKQADVVALLGVFTEAFSAKEKAASLDYYWPFTIHDSSNSMCHHQIVLANIGRSEQAYDAWIRSIETDFGVQLRCSNGIHCANIGGMWQEVVFGFLGMVSALNTETLTFHPCLPKEFRSITTKLQWRGQWVEVALQKELLTLVNHSSRPLAFIVGDKEYQVEPDATKEVFLES
jgi:trehalose/maltose hydrolase-like predicted phosphorylase